MKGLLLSEQFYREIGKPAFSEAFPDVFDRLAFGLCGEGSECYGYDDEISRDHDFGPGFCVWVPDELLFEYGDRLHGVYKALPDEYAGIRRIPSKKAQKRVGVFGISEFFAGFIGREQPPSSKLRWLLLPENRLSEITNGMIFEDGDGRVTALRAAISEYFPEDVRLKKIAMRAEEMAKTGQYNYARAMARGDVVTAQIALADFAKSAMRMVYLLNRRFAPYYKWLHRGIGELRICSEAYGLIDRLMRLNADESVWVNADNRFLNTADERVLTVERLCELVRGELSAQGIIGEGSDFLDDRIEEILSNIDDEEIRYY